MFESVVKKRILTSLARIEHGSLLFTTPEGERLHFQGKKAGSQADIHVKDWRVLVNFSLKGDVGFADDYRNGFFHTSDLEKLLCFGLENGGALQQVLDGGWWHRQFSKFGYLTKRNTLKGSKKNIQAHYDLGNDFYQLWLDPTMTYSSGLFKHEGESLTQAQYNKYDRIIERLPENGRCLEIGCGWGGFANRLQAQRDFQYKGITLSKRQRDYAVGILPNEISVQLEDYRHQQGKYDAIVSIEMLEAVGVKYWPVYFQKIKSMLKPGGKALVQTITVADELYDSYAKSADMIRTYIFPGGMLPSKSILKQQLANAGLKCQDMFDFGDSYAKTLSQWLKNFNSVEQQLKATNFDEAFQRLWRFYLAGCVATFSSGRTDVIQMEITHA